MSKFRRKDALKKKGFLVLDLYEQYLVGSGRLPSTIEKRMYQLRYFKKHNANFPFCTEEQIDQFMANVLRNAKPEYRKSYRTAIRGFYAWARKRKLIDHDPAYLMETVKIPRPLPRPMPEADLMESYERATEEGKAMILLGAMGGLRLAEITNLHMEDREGNLLRVLGKGKKERIIPMNASLTAALDRLEFGVEPGFYFRNPDTQKARSVSYVHVHLKRHLGKKYAAHSLRHRAASIAYGATKDIRAVQELLGHASVATTQLYTAITSDDLKAVSFATDWNKVPQ
jgi:site-specific recombinase XerD